MTNTQIDITTFIAILGSSLTLTGWFIAVDAKLKLDSPLFGIILAVVGIFIFAASFTHIQAVKDSNNKKF